jgi:hypothetical protein
MWISWISRLGAAATAVDAIIEPATTPAAAPVARRLSVDTIRFSRCGLLATDSSGSVLKKFNGFAGSRHWARGRCE